MALQARSVLLSHRPSLSSWRNPLSDTPVSCGNCSRSGTGELKLRCWSVTGCAPARKGRAYPQKRAGNQGQRCHPTLGDLQGSRERLAEQQTGWPQSPTAQDNQGDSHILVCLPVTPAQSAHWEPVPTAQQQSHEATRTRLPAFPTHCPSSPPLKSQQDRLGGLQALQ